MSELKRKGNIVVVVAFAFFMFVTCYKLTNASLWFDETIEYWYSKVMFGPLPFNDSSNMYRRIISTYQPPLYNILMFLWLKVSDTEWWFRFFGVVMGLIGMVGIYKCIKKINNSSVWAAIAVVFSTCVYQLQYYWQECAEYCLMLGSLCWTVYFFICLTQDVNRKNIIYFTISAIIPIYSQYGAVFPVLAMIIIAFIVVIMNKDKGHIMELSIAYTLSFVLAALPLYFLFLRKQMVKQQGEMASFQSLHLDSGIIKEIWGSLHMVFRWNMASYYEVNTTKIILIIILMLSIVVLIWGKSKIAKLLIIVNGFAWLFYYVAVELGIYSYGSYGNRYNLFFIPLWIISVFAICNEIHHMIVSKKFMGSMLAGWTFLAISLCFIAYYCIFSWFSVLQSNWTKEDIRGVVDSWYLQDAVSENTLVYYGANSGFSYYVRQNECYNDQTENNVIYMRWYRDKSEEEYREYIDSIYGESWPKDIYLVASHYGEDLDTITGQFISKGYEMQNIYDENGGRLVRLTYFSDNDE